MGTVNERKKVTFTIRDIVTATAVALLAVLAFSLFVAQEEKAELRMEIALRDTIIGQYKEFLTPRVSSSTSYSLIRDGREVTYKELLEENVKLTNDLQRMSTELGLIRRNYDITVQDKHGKISVYAPAIDSALLLLNVYRDKIRYDAEQGVWLVER